MICINLQVVFTQILGQSALNNLAAIDTTANRAQLAMDVSGHFVMTLCLYYDYVSVTPKMNIGAKSFFGWRALQK